MAIGDIIEQLASDPDPAAASRFMLRETGGLNGLASPEEIESQGQVTSNVFSSFSIGLALIQAQISYWTYRIFLPDSSVAAAAA